MILLLLLAVFHLFDVNLFFFFLSQSVLILDNLVANKSCCFMFSCYLISFRLTTTILFFTHAIQWSYSLGKLSTWIISLIQYFVFGSFNDVPNIILSIALWFVFRFLMLVIMSTPLHRRRWRVEHTNHINPFSSLV